MNRRMFLRACLGGVAAMASRRLPSTGAGAVDRHIVIEAANPGPAAIDVSWTAPHTYGFAWPDNEHIVALGEPLAGVLEHSFAGGVPAWERQMRRDMGSAMAESMERLFMNYDQGDIEAAAVVAEKVQGIFRALTPAVEATKQGEPETVAGQTMVWLTEKVRDKLSG